MALLSSQMTLSNTFASKGTPDNEERMSSNANVHLHVDNELDFCETPGLGRTTDNVFNICSNFC